MPPPTSTPEQRAVALAKAAAVREERQEIKARVKAGTMSIADLFDKAGDPVYGKLRIKMVLGWVPGIGPVQVRRLLEACEIDEKKFLRSFNEAQRGLILRVLP